MPTPESAPQKPNRRPPSSALRPGLPGVNYPGRPAVFARSANVVNGPQQVNVGPQTNEGAARAGGASGKPASELLEGKDGERLDTGAQGTSGGSNRVVEAVGAVDRAEDGRG